MKSETKWGKGNTAGRRVHHCPKCKHHFVLRRFKRCPKCKTLLIAGNEFWASVDGKPTEEGYWWHPNWRKWIPLDDIENMSNYEPKCSLLEQELYEKYVKCLNA